MAARQVQHTFQTPAATGLLQRFLDLEDEVRTHYQAQPAVQPAPAQPPVYEFDNARLFSAVTYISGEGAAAGAPVVPAAEQGRVADDLVRILRDHVAYESFEAADFAFAGLPQMVAELPAAMAERWAQVGVGTQTVAQVFAQHQAFTPAVHIPIDVATYFSLAPQSDGVAVRDALRQIPVQQQQQQQNPRALGWGAQLRGLVPRPQTLGQRIAVYLGLSTLVLGAALSFGSYQGWNCGPSPSPVAQAPAQAPTAPSSTQSPAPVVPGAQSLPPDLGIDAAASASQNYTSPAATGRADGGASPAASVGTVSVPPVLLRLDGGVPAQPAAPVAPVAPVVPGPVGPPQLRPWSGSDGGVPNTTPYVAQTPPPRMDGGVPATSSPAAPYIAAPVAPTAPVAPAVPAPAVVCPPIPVCNAPWTDLLTTRLTSVKGYSWEQFINVYARVPIAISIRDYKGSDPRVACVDGIGHLVDLTLGSMPGAQQHALYDSVKSVIMTKGVDACAAHVNLSGKNRDKDIQFGLGLDKL